MINIIGNTIIATKMQSISADAASNFVLNDITDTTISLTWDGAGALERATLPDYSNATTIYTGSTGYTDTGRTQDTTYYYRINGLTKTFKTFTTEYQSVVSLYSTGIPSLYQRIAADEYYKAWEAIAGNGLSSLDLLYVFETDGDRDFAKINWRNPSTFAATESGSLTFAANTGFVGTGGYLNTNWVPLTNANAYTQNNCSVGIYNRAESPILDSCLFGAINSTGTSPTYLQPFRTSNLSRVVGPNSTTAISGGVIATRAGMYHAKRTGATAAAFFKDGVSLGTGAGASAALANQSMLINAVNNTTGPGLIGNFNVGMFWAGASLNGQEVAIVSAHTAYLAALNIEVLTNVTYSSSIDSISDLSMRICYDNHHTIANLPIFIIMHGWSQSATSFTDTTLRRLKNRGLFVAAVGMRGRNGASGSKDASARELYDIYDAINYIKANYSASVNQNVVVIDGYSGGGGNVLGMASRFPDLANLYVSFFGISDYGYDATYGWYQNTPTEQSDLSTSIGGTPSGSIKNNYKSREHLWSASNCKGRLLMYHDEDDALVQVYHSQRVVTQLIADGFTNYVYNESGAGDANRWLHGLPNAGVTGEENIAAEPTIMSEIASSTTPVLPTSGTLKINGGLHTKLFKIWLGNGTSANDTRNRRATLVYDYDANTYTITPSIDSPDTSLTVSITILSGVNSGKTASGTISSSTLFTPV